MEMDSNTDYFFGSLFGYFIKILIKMNFYNLLLFTLLCDVLKLTDLEKQRAVAACLGSGCFVTLEKFGYGMKGVLRFFFSVTLNLIILEKLHFSRVVSAGCWRGWRGAPGPWGVPVAEAHIGGSSWAALSSRQGLLRTALVSLQFAPLCTFAFISSCFSLLVLLLWRHL